MATDVLRSADRDNSELTTETAARWPEIALYAALFELALFAPLGKVLTNGSPAIQAVADVSLLIGALVVISAGSTHLHLQLIDLVLAGLALLVVIEIANPNVLSAPGALPVVRTYFIGFVWYIIGRVYALRYDKASRRRLLQALLVATLIEAIWALRQAFLPLAIDAALQSYAASSQIVYIVASVGTPRIFGSMSGPFHIGFLTCCGALMAYFTFGRLRWPIVAAMVATLFYSYTRSMWLALILGVVVVILASPTGQSRAIQNLLRGLILVAVVSAVLGTLYADTVAVPGESSDLVTTAQYDLQLREVSWNDYILPTIFDTPLGLGTSSASDQVALSPPTAIYYTSHSQLFKFLLELGWLGGLVYVILIVGSCATFWRLAAGDERPIGLLGLSLTAALVIAGITTPVLDTYPATVPFWIVLGMAVSLTGRRVNGRLKASADRRGLPSTLPGISVRHLSTRGS
jgi:hypothetical protein